MAHRRRRGSRRRRTSSSGQPLRPDGATRRGARAAAGVPRAGRLSVRRDGRGRAAAGRPRPRRLRRGPGRRSRPDTVTASPPRRDRPRDARRVRLGRPRPPSGTPRVVGTVGHRAGGPVGARLPARRPARSSPSATPAACCGRSTTACRRRGGRRRSEAAAPEGEAGLLGVAVSPDFDSDRRPCSSTLTTAEDNRIVRATYDEGDRLGEPEVRARRHPERLHPRRRPARVRARRLPLRLHRRDRRRRARPGPRLARRQDPADHPRRRPRARQPRSRTPPSGPRPPQRAGPRLRRPGPAVGQRVRRLDLRRAQPDRDRAATTAGPRSRAAAAEAAFVNPRVVWDHRRGLARRGSPSPRATCGSPRCAAPALADRRRPAAGRRADGLLRRRLRPDAHRAVAPDGTSG